MYDPSLGRWLQMDPEGFEAGDANLYAYVGNGPTDAADPNGTTTSGQGSPALGSRPPLPQGGCPPGGLDMWIQDKKPYVLIGPEQGSGRKRSQVIVVIIENFTKDTKVSAAAGFFGKYSYPLVFVDAKGKLVETPQTDARGNAKFFVQFDSRIRLGETIIIRVDAGKTGYSNEYSVTD